MEMKKVKAIAKTYTQEEINKLTETKMKQLFDKGAINDDMFQRWHDNQQFKASIIKEAEKEFQSINLPQDVFSRETINDLNKRSKAIRLELGKVESSFFKIAFNLTYIKENDSYKALGFDNIYDFANKEFGIARGTCSNFINVVKRFGTRNLDGTIGDSLQLEFKDFKSSQLTLMLGMDNKELNQINKDMSVRDIKKVKKEAEQSVSDSSENSNYSSDSEPIDVNSKNVNRQVMLTLRNKDDYDKNIDKIDTMILRALKDSKYTIEIAYTWD